MTPDFPKTDHDLLNRLDVKVDDIKIQVQNLKDDSIARLAKLELRVDKIEVYNAQFPDAKELASNVRVFQSNWKVIAVIWSALISIMTAIVVRILTMEHLL